MPSQTKRRSRSKKSKSTGVISLIKHRKWKKLNKKFKKALHPKDKTVWIWRITVLAAAVVFIVGITLAISESIANHRAVSYAKKEIALANEGKPSAAPATIKPTSNDIADYTVPANMPRYLIIPSINVYARIYPVGLTKAGAIGVPTNVYDTDWYNGSSLPGQSGASVIDGHVSSWTAHGVFYSIKTLTPGAIIKVQMGSGTLYTYRVVRSQVYSASNVNMTQVLSPVAAAKPGLNLITCTGDVIAGTNSFNERIVVFAEEL